MRVLVVTHYFPAHGGGVELVAYHLTQQLADMGHEVVWFASDTDPAPSSIARITCEPVPAWNLAESMLQVPFPIWSPLWLGRLWRAIGRVDVVHIHEYVYLGNLTAAMMAWLRRKPVVVTQHTGAVMFPIRWLRRLYAGVNRSLGRYVLRRANHVVFISENVRQYFSGFCRFVRPPSLIFNGLDPAWHPAKSEDERRCLRRDLGIHDDRHVLLFAGRFVEKKGLDVIRSLVPQFQQEEWLMAGNGPVRPEQWGYERVKVLGMLDPRQLAQVYRAADLLILPSHSEGFPLVVQEALACGTAVLSTDEVAAACPEAADMVRSAPVPTAKAHRIEWVQALRQVLADRDFIRGRASRSMRARHLWSWRSCAEAYLDVYAAASAEVQER